MDVRSELLFWRPPDLKTQLSVGFYGYGKGGRKYEEVREALNMVRVQLNVLRTWPWSERDMGLDYNEFENIWEDEFETIWQLEEE